MNAYSCFSGFISSQGKGVYFTIPLSKPMIGITDVAITGKLLARGVNGNITGSSTVNFDTNCTYDYAFVPNGIYIKMEYESAMSNAVNNTPVTLVPYDGGITITFN